MGQMLSLRIYFCCPYDVDSYWFGLFSLDISFFPNELDNRIPYICIMFKCMTIPLQIQEISDKYSNNMYFEHKIVSLWWNFNRTPIYMIYDSIDSAHNKNKSKLSGSDFIWIFLFFRFELYLFHSICPYFGDWCVSFWPYSAVDWEHSAQTYFIVAAVYILNYFFSLLFSPFLHFQPNVYIVYLIPWYFLLVLSVLTSSLDNILFLVVFLWRFVMVLTYESCHLCIKFVFI